MSAETFAHRKGEFIQWVKELTHAGVSMIQIREKRIATRQLYELSRDAAAITAGAATLLLINDRADIAAAAGADGVHLTGRSIGVEHLRNAFRGLRIVVSTHASREVIRAREGGADFAVFGPVFETPDKGPAVGVQILREAVESAGELPLLALGGLSLDNASTVTETGAAGLAGIRGFRTRDQIEKLQHLMS